MRTHAFMLVLTLGVLSGCGSTRAQIEQTVEDIADTASGRITEVKDRIEKGIQPVKDTVSEVNERVESVREGVEKIQEGADLLEQGMGR